MMKKADIMHKNIKKILWGSSIRKITTSFAFGMILILLSLVSSKSSFKQETQEKTKAETPFEIFAQDEASPSAQVHFVYPNKIGLNETRKITMLAEGTADSYRYYLHDNNTLNGGTNGDPVVQSYDPNNVQPDTFHYLGEGNASNNYTIQINYPKTAGTYKIVMNLVKGEYICSWEKKLLKGTPGGSFTETGQTCDTTNPASFQVTNAVTDPSVDTAAPFPNPILGGTTQEELRIVGNGAGSGRFAIYLHGTNTPKGGTDPNPDIPKPIGSYDPNNIVPQDFYYLGDNYVKIPPPSKAGTYFIAVNAIDGNKICAWDKRLYLRQTDGSVIYSGQTCNNKGLQTLNITAPFVSTSNVSPFTVSPGESFTFILNNGSSGRLFWIYLHGTDQPTASDPVNAPYDPANLDSKTFYKIGTITQGEQLLVTAPHVPGTYYLVINAHSDINPTSWTTNDQVCTWEGKLYHLSNAQYESYGTCENPGAVALTVTGPTETPTSTPDPSVTQNPSATPEPSATPDPSVTADPTPTDSPTNTPPVGGTDPTSTPTPTTPDSATATPPVNITPTENPDITTQPSASPGSEYKISMRIFLPGIGNKKGDNSQPKEKSKTLQIDLRSKLSEGSATIGEPPRIRAVPITQLSYSNGFGGYEGTISLSESEILSSNIVVRINNSLWKTIPISRTGGAYAAQPITLNTGDLKINNKIDIEDYNIFYSCIKTFNSTKKLSSTCVSADLNSNGKIDNIDYNILLRAYQNPIGD